MQEHLDIIFFIYGLSFVVAGLAVLLQPRRQSAFALSRILWLLAAFALIHGVNEWLDMWTFIKGRSPLLDLVRWLFLASSYVFIFEFGRRLVLLGVSRGVRRALPAWLVPFIGMVVFTSAVFSDDFWATGSALVRYLYGFPGAVLAGVGFFQYYSRNEEKLAPLEVRAYFQGAGTAFTVYGFLGGIIVSPAGFFPASAFNTELFLATTGVPVQAFRSVAALVTAVTVTGILKIFNWEHAKSLEDALSVAREARDTLEQRVRERTSDLEREIEVRKRVEDRQRLFVRLYEKASEAIIITDRMLKAVNTNGAFTEMTGYSLDDVSGVVPPVLSSIKRGVWKEIWAAVDEKGYWQGEVWGRKKDKTPFAALMGLVAIEDSEGRAANYGILLYDITERKRTERRVENLAYYDTLTGLPNRTLFYDRLSLAIAHASRHGKPLALMFIDLDNFKIINDTLGHHVGDMLIKQVGEKLTGCIRKDTTVARLGGDEFTVILADIKGPESAEVVARRIFRCLASPFTLEDYEYYITSSIGIAMFPNDGQAADELIQNSDAAMYHAKERGKDNYQFYSSEMNAESRKRLDIERKIREALRKNLFEVHFQPQVDAETGELTGQEALIRWPVEGGVRQPGEFLPLAEQSGLIFHIDKWVLKTVIAQVQRWRAEGLKVPPTAVNMTSLSIKHVKAEKVITQIIGRAGLEPEFLEVELTESGLMEDTELTKKRFGLLKSLGVGLVVDDFGTGYSSLYYLKHFNVDKIKIDREFVKDCTTDNEDAAIVKAIIALGRSLGARVVAEGVETKEQLEFLRANGCDYIQGYYVSRPIPPAEYVRLLTSGTSFPKDQAG